MIAVKENADFPAEIKWLWSI